VYSRLKKLEEKILYLEGLSPEYFNYKVENHVIDVRLRLVFWFIQRDSVRSSLSMFIIDRFWTSDKQTNSEDKRKYFR
jgi:hypothetical protein